MGEDSGVRSCWTLRIVLAPNRHNPKGKQVFSQNVGDSYHNACWWMRDNIREVEAVLEKHIDDAPKVILEDTFVSEDN